MTENGRVDAAVALLAHAQVVLTGHSPSSSPTLAAFLGRQAAEALIEQRCTELVGPITGATTKSKLAILKSLDRTEAGQALVLSWYRLSGYCHVHAYELPPTVGEVQATCEQVAAAMTPQ
ncbi:hypothetical protein [Gordonia polyisoprenivorans]|uniref:hypothetical protein n=1 Tax=Gordonia polyisoprenivorans TaxID=84595 RepID=UPI00036AD238|nr:hypothetical protein [Gordonia polyisoprenivorans]